MPFDLEGARRELAENPLALINAAEEGNLAKACKLIAAGADVEARDSFQETALHNAALLDDTRITKLLIDYKALVNVQNKKGMTPLHKAANRITNGMTPRYLAINRGSMEMVQLLLEHNADILIQDHEGMTALHYARTLPVFKALLLHSFRPKHVLPLKQLCLNHLSSRELSPELLNRMSPTLQKELSNADLERKRADITCIHHVLTLKNHRGETARDVAAQRATNRSSYNDIVAFIDNVLKAKTFNEFKELGWRG